MSIVFACQPRWFRCLSAGQLLVRQDRVRQTQPVGVLLGVVSSRFLSGPM